MVNFGHAPGSHPLSQGWTPKLSSIKCHMRGFGTRNGRSEVPLLFRDFHFFLLGRFFPDGVCIKVGSAGATFITDPVVAKDLRVSKCSGIHSTNHCVVPWDVPDQISAALSYAVLSGCCPRNTKKERMVLQIAGKNSTAFVKWVLENIVGDYGCHIQSVLDIPKDRTIRVIFFELDSLSKHVLMLLRQVRQRKVHPLLTKRNCQGLTATGNRIPKAPKAQSAPHLRLPDQQRLTS